MVFSYCAAPVALPEPIRVLRGPDGYKDGAFRD
jgi:hypothetical protein